MVVVLASLAAPAQAWVPAVCGGDRAATYCDDGGAAMEGWEKDVRALQALHRDCGMGLPWGYTPEAVPWQPVPLFSGSRSDWDDTCTTGGDELACDADGRVTLINIKPDMMALYQLNCPLGLPAEFNDMVELSVLRMDVVLRTSGGANISHFFQPLLSLTKLREISLANNDLTGEMPQLCDFDSFSASAGKLSVLRLNNNALTGPPASSLACLTVLTELDVSNNQLVGQLPDTWASLVQLQTLRLFTNYNLGGTIPAAWFVSSGGMGSLLHLEAEYCSLSGTIPTDIGAADSLETMKLGNNLLTGPLPASITSLTDLKTLDVEHNQLSGALPAILFANVYFKLTDVDMSNNQLNGSIPSMSTNGPALVRLDLSSNQLSGSVPALASLSNLVQLSLADNLLDGVITDLCGTSSSMEDLQLQGNALDGAIPDLSCLGQMETLDASNNKLSSGLGSWLSNANLESVNLAGNDLTGDLPATICGVRTKTLDLRGNLLTGAVPESIGDCTQLKSLYLGAAAQHLGRTSGVASGTTPTLPSATAMAKLTDLTTLSLAGLGLTGTVPTTIFSLPILSVLDLSHNSLTGSIPEVTAEKMISLTLEGNALTGSVPASLLTLPMIFVLLLADNQLTGIESPTASSTIALTGIYLAGNRLTAIPTVVQDMAALTVLDLSRNLLAAGPSNVQPHFSSMNGTTTMVLSLSPLSYPSSTILTVKGNECQTLAGGIRSPLARSATNTRDSAAERERPERAAEHVAGR